MHTRTGSGIARRSGPRRLIGWLVLASACGGAWGAAAVPLAAAEPPAAADADRAAIERRLQELEGMVATLKAEVDRLRAARTTGTDTESAMRIDELQHRIEALTRELERQRIGAAAAPAAGESKHGFGPAASKVYGPGRGVSIGGYGEMLYQNFTRTRDDGSLADQGSVADLLRAVLYFGYKFDDRFVFNSEIEFEHAQAGEDAGGEVSVEFAYLDFKAAPSFGVRGGLLLVPMGFLNELHEPPIFHGARRPEVERVIIPTTWRENGAGVYGDAGPVSYRAYVLNSFDADGLSAASGLRGGRQSASKAKATDLAFTARVDYTPIPGLVLGTAALTGKSGQGADGFPEGRITVWDAHGEFNWRGLRLRGLVARGIISDAGEISAAQAVPLTGPDGIGERLRGWYAEAAYNVLSTVRGTRQDLSLFCRYEGVDTQARVAPGFSDNPANAFTVRTCGVTYRPIPNIAIKVDAQNFNNDANTAVDQVNVGLGYLF